LGAKYPLWGKTIKNNNSDQRPLRLWTTAITVIDDHRPGDLRVLGTSIFKNDNRKYNAFMAVMKYDMYCNITGRHPCDFIICTKQKRDYGQIFILK
jgi:hypothetical protein